MSTPALTLTDRQSEIIEFIRACVAERGYPPSVREIGDEFGMTSTSSVHHHLRKLTEAGWLRREGYRSRAITVVDEPAVA